LAPVISGFDINTKTSKLDSRNIVDDTSSISFYTFDKASSRECSVDLS
jgi:hypothetical protein